MKANMLIRKALPSDAAGITRVHIDSWRTTYRGLVPDEYLDGLSCERGVANWDSLLRNPAEGCSVFVVEGPSGNIVGFASAGPARPATAAATSGSEAPPGYPPGHAPHEGEIYAIYLLVEHQRRGLGSRLLQAAAAELSAQRMRSMIIWVLAGNPSRLFYEALGGREVGRQDIVIGGVVLEEIAYRWPDLGALG